MPLLIIIFLFCFQQIAAQPVLGILYTEKLHASKGALAGMVQQQVKSKDNQGGKSADSLEPAQQEKMDLLAETLYAGTAGLSPKQRLVYREENYIISREVIKDRRSISLQFNLTNFNLLVIDSFTFSRLDSVTSRLLPVTDPAKKLLVDITKEYKNISGFKCRKILITEQNYPGDDSENRFFEIWATTGIRPSIPLYGVLRLREKILADYTPLLIREYMDKKLDFFGETVVAEIRR